MELKNKLKQLKPHDLNCNVFDVYSYSGLTMQELLCQFFTKINECVEVSNNTLDLADWLVNEGLEQETAKKLVEWYNDGSLEKIINNTLFEGLNNKIDFNTNEISNINLQIEHINNNNIRTPQHYGAKGDGVTNDSEALYNAIVDCANNGYILLLNGKYRVATNIVYNAWKPLTIIGSRGNYPSLTSEEFTRQNESFDIYLDDATIEINKMGSVTFQGVGFASSSKTSGKGILLKSFHNKFVNCAFSQMEKAIHIMKGTNWVGENQIMFSQFFKCSYGIYVDESASSDSEVIGNVFHGTCNVGFYGSCAGFTFSLNHFYNKKSNVFKHFNTKIVDNYIQETDDETPSIILNGSFGCMINNNNFELNNSDPRNNKMGLIGIELRAGGGNITINGNAVHGKNISTIENLAFIDMIYSSTRHDMPIHLGTNNIKCCSSILKEYYPLYNFKGNFTISSLELSPQGGNIQSQTVNVVNGIAYFHVVMDSVPSYANLLKVQHYQGIPFQYTLKQTLKAGGTKIVSSMSNGSMITQSNYSEVASVEVVGSYLVAHATEPKFTL